MKTAVRHILAAIIRIGLFPLRLLEVIFELAEVGFKALGEACEVIHWRIGKVAKTIRNAFPWPFIAKFSEKWEKADHEERRRLVRRLSDWSGEEVEK